MESVFIPFFLSFLLSVFYFTVLVHTRPNTYIFEEWMISLIDISILFSFSIVFNIRFDEVDGIFYQIRPFGTYRRFYFIYGPMRYRKPNEQLTLKRIRYFLIDLLWWQPLREGRKTKKKLRR